MTSHQDQPKPLFSFTDINLGVVSFMFFIPDCPEKDDLMQAITQNGGVVVPTPGCGVYQLKPDSVSGNQQQIQVSDVSKQLYASNILYEAKWVADCIAVGKLISKKDYIVRNFIGARRILKQKSSFTIIECMRMYDTVEVRGNGKGGSRSFWKKVADTGFFPDRSFESLLNRWKQTLSKMSRTQYLDHAKMHKQSYSSSLKEIPYPGSNKFQMRNYFSHMVIESDKEEQKTLENRVTSSHSDIDEAKKQYSQEYKHIKKKPQAKKHKSPSFKQQESYSAQQDYTIDFGGHEIEIIAEQEKQEAQPEPVLHSVEDELSQLSLQALNVSYKTADRRLKFLEPSINKKELQEIKVIAEQEDQQISAKTLEDAEAYMLSIMASQENSKIEVPKAPEGWCPDFDHKAIGQKMKPLSERFKIFDEDQDQKPAPIVRRIITVEGNERRVQIQSQSSSSSEKINEFLQFFIESYKDVLVNEEELEQLVNDYNGDFEAIESHLQKRARWTPFKEQVIKDVREDSESFAMLVREFGEERVQAKKEELLSD